MKFYKIIVVFLLIFSGCCKDEIVKIYRLNNFEKSLIPYNSYQELSFIDDEGNMIIANAQPKESIIETRRPGPESCQLTEYEKEKSSLNFPFNDIVIRLDLESGSSTHFTLIASSENTFNNGNFEIACEGLFNFSIQERLTDVSINEFDFQNVLIFQDCRESTEILQIVYSSINGVEFIEFKDGKWFKLVS